MSSDNAKKSETLPHLDWQSELDATMEEIDTRLTHPRRRASDRAPQPPLPGLGDGPLSAEIMDEIAWRVAEQIRRNAQVFSADAEAAPPPAIDRRRAPAVQDEGLRPGKMLMLRYRWPALPWPFRLLRRRREHPLTTAKLRA